MSASPASGTPGATPNGTPRPPMPRKKPPVDPLVRRKPPRRPIRAPAFAHDPNSKDPSKPANDFKPTGQLQTGNNYKALHDAKPPTNVKAPLGSQASRPRDRARFEGATELEIPEAQIQSATISLADAASGPKASGFTTAKPGTYTDYPVFMSRGELTAGLRAHVARFSSKQGVDPSSQQEWTRPVRLHRRDPRAAPPGGKSEVLEGKDVEIEEERQKQELLRAQREAQRAAALAEVAPSMSNPNPKRAGAGQRKTTQFFNKEATEEQRERNKLKYEEALPWHLEDFDNRQTWVGSYEAALSGAYAQLVFKDDKFYMAPLEKWYKFTQKRVFKTQEELEASDAKREMKNPKWLLNYQQDQEDKKTEQQNRMASSKLYDGTVNGRATNAALGSSAKKDKEDFDELDFDEDMADDEEDPVFEGEGDETKETKKRIKKDQLQANIFDMKDEKSYDKAEQREKVEQRMRKDDGKRVRKALMKRERNFIYDSDSDHAYSENSETEDSEEERRKEEEKKKKEEEEKKKSTLPGSGASTKGTNTPSGRKKQDPQHNASSNTLKPSRSPDLSEASGNESARQIQKKKRGTPSGLASGIDTPNGHSRSRSPAINSDTNIGRSNGTGTLKKKKKATAGRGNELKRPRGAGSGSEGDGAGSGGDMSDGSRKKIKLKAGAAGSKNVSPSGSRAASPSRDAAVTGGQTGAAKTGKSPDPPPTVPTLDEVKRLLPEAGQAFNVFIKTYKPVMHHSETKAAFMELMRTHFRIVQVNGEKMIKPK